MTKGKENISEVKSVFKHYMLSKLAGGRRPWEREGSEENELLCAIHLNRFIKIFYWQLV